jgi:CheY-like chemotaxis protein
MKRVLLVEDSELIRSIVCDALQTCFPCVTTVVEDGAQALEELSHNSYDLVITDIMMPVMDGITLTQKIRNELVSDVPIVMMTSLNEDKVRESASEAGANAYVTKPIDYNQLIQVVDNLVLPASEPEPEELPEIQIISDSDTEESEE